ncbi:hypothetical protein HZ326_15046 [Fusarium oxysporum f. sp. albedinis]|nr:hypothetical protein HZ326_15046 [Fusarium oxysporum f. sp. albedinis]
MCSRSKITSGSVNPLTPMHVDDPGLLTAQPDLSNAARSDSSLGPVSLHREAPLAEPHVISRTQVVGTLLSSEYPGNLYRSLMGIQSAQHGNCVVP